MRARVCACERFVYQFSDNIFNFWNVSVNIINSFAKINSLQKDIRKQLKDQLKMPDEQHFIWLFEHIEIVTQNDIYSQYQSNRMKNNVIKSVIKEILNI